MEAERRTIRVAAIRRVMPEPTPRETRGEPAAGKLDVASRSAALPALPALPSLGRRAGNYLRAAGVQAVGAVKSGRWYRTEELAEQLHGICRTPNEEEKAQGLTCCQYYRAVDDKCAHPKCGCNLKNGLLGSKTKWHSTRCPEKRWDAAIGGTTALTNAQL